MHHNLVPSKTGQPKPACRSRDLDGPGTTTASCLTFFAAAQRDFIAFALRLRAAADMLRRLRPVAVGLLVCNPCCRDSVRHGLFTEVIAHHPKCYGVISQTVNLEGGVIHAGSESTVCSIRRQRQALY
jgi:hypothetical protein